MKLSASIMKRTGTTFAGYLVTILTMLFLNALFLIAGAAFVMNALGN